MPNTYITIAANVMNAMVENIAIGIRFNFNFICFPLLFFGAPQS